MLLSIGAVFILFCAGCPVGIAYPPGEPGSESIEKDIVGTWENDKSDGTILKVKITKGEGESYEAEVLEKGEMYALETMKLKGYVTKLEGFDLIYFIPEGEESYYTYEFRMDGKNRLITHDVSLKVGGVDAVTSTEAFREELRASMKFDDWLSEEQTYIRK